MDERAVPFPCSETVRRSWSSSMMSVSFEPPAKKKRVKRRERRWKHRDARESTIQSYSTPSPFHVVPSLRMRSVEVNLNYGRRVQRRGGSAVAASSPERRKLPLTSESTQAGTGAQAAGLKEARGSQPARQFRPVPQKPASEQQGALSGQRESTVHATPWMKPMAVVVALVLLELGSATPVPHFHGVAVASVELAVRP